jgi:hypothetical protein
MLLVKLDPELVEGQLNSPIPELVAYTQANAPGNKLVPELVEGPA